MTTSGWERRRGFRPHGVDTTGDTRPSLSLSRPGSTPLRRARPCDICRRIHPGRCVPDDARSAKLNITIPGRVDRRLRDRIPWGDRSKWVRSLIEAELDHLDALEAMEQAS